MGPQIVSRGQRGGLILGGASSEGRPQHTQVEEKRQWERQQVSMGGRL